MSENPLVQEIDGRQQPTRAGYQYLDGIVTDVAGPVYAFSTAADPAMVAAAMARLSRSPDDMRLIILKEFATAQSAVAAASQGAEAAALLERVITAYGDDSVQQLVGIHLVVEGASNLLTKLLEWGRLASYLEQSTRYIYFDRTDASGRYRFFTPAGLPESLVASYDATMMGIFDNYSYMVRRLTEHVRAANPLPDGENRTAWEAATRAQACDAVRPVLPVATQSTVGIFASAQAVDNLVMFLLSQDLPEARAAGQAIYDQAVQVIPNFLRRTMVPERGLATVAYRAETRRSMQAMMNGLLPPAAAPAEQETVWLADFWPQDETELVPEMLFPYSDRTLSELMELCDRMGPDQLRDVMRAYIGERLNRRHKPGRALEIAHYEFEILGDYGTFRDLQRHRMVDAWEWQRLTPRYGYDVPDLVRQAGLEHHFRACFQSAKELYERLNGHGFREEAAYATLLGHKMRYRFVANARSLMHLLELRTSPQGHPGYRAIGQEMHRLISEVHPQLAAAMRFVNQSDMDGELTRLAAERATQFKLANLKSP